MQFVDGHFVESYYPTIENTFSKVIRYKGQDYATEIIDTAGQVRNIAGTRWGRRDHAAARLGIEETRESSRGGGNSVAAGNSEEQRLTGFSPHLLQDEYSILNSKHFIGIHGYMIVYSVASKQTFEMARIIRDKILNHLVRNHAIRRCHSPPPCASCLLPAKSHSNILLVEKWWCLRERKRENSVSGEWANWAAKPMSQHKIC